MNHSFVYYPAFGTFVVLSGIESRIMIGMENGEIRGPFIEASLSDVDVWYIYRRDRTEVRVEVKSGKLHSQYTLSAYEVNWFKKRGII